MWVTLLAKNTASQVMVHLFQTIRRSLIVKGYFTLELKVGCSVAFELLTEHKNQLLANCVAPNIELY